MAMSVGVVSLGCSKNTVDTEQILGQLKNHGNFTLVQNPGDAQILMVNTCGFIQAAKEESIEAILEMASYKNSSKGKCELLVVTGCLAQRYSKELLEEIPEIDLLMGVNQYDKLLEGINQAIKGEKVQITGRSDQFFETQRLLTTPHYMGYVRIGDGCNNRCAFCAIPLIRGRYRSRNEEDILKEMATLAGQGVKEQIFIAQDTTRYGTEWAKESQLPYLLKKGAQIEGIEWLRVLYCYPEGTDEKLLDTIANTPNICKYLDLPIQHIDEEVLMKMGRRGTPNQIKKVLKMARDQGLALRSTLIVGFPGESQDAFNRLYDFVGEQAFDHLGVFAYSPEEGTIAATMEGQIPQEVKEERLDKIMTLQKSLSKKRKEERIGRVEKVLVSAEIGKNQYKGRSQWEAPDIDGEIYFTARGKLKTGNYTHVKFTKAETYDLIGEEYELT